MERIEPSLETGINQASSHKHDDDSITAAIITAAFDADRDHVRDLCCHHTKLALRETTALHSITGATLQMLLCIRSVLFGTIQPLHVSVVYGRALMVAARALLPRS